jgi:hypothetical protein
MASMARAMVTVTKVAGEQQRNDCGNGNNTGDRDWDEVVRDNEGNGQGGKGNSNSHENGRQQRGQWQGWQGQWQWQ